MWSRWIPENNYFVETFFDATGFALQSVEFIE
jgi:hypothetical protein